MKKTFAVIIVMAALLLGGAAGLKNVAQSNLQKKHIELMQTLLPNGKDFVKITYTGDDANIKSVHKADIGYVIETETQGYADIINMYIAVDNKGVVTGLVVNESYETNGIGNKILTDHKFLAQFLNKSGVFSIDIKADAFSSATGNTTQNNQKDIYVDGITGATVSSKAVARCVNSAIGYVTGADVQSSATTWGG